VRKSGKDRKLAKSLEEQVKAKTSSDDLGCNILFDWNSKSVDKGSTSSEIELEPCTQYKIKVRPFYSNDQIF
jgi:hypothetical protein